MRAAAKNHDRVTIVVDPKDYERVSTELKKNGDTTLATRYGHDGKQVGTAKLNKQ